MPSHRIKGSIPGRRTAARSDQPSTALFVRLTTFTGAWCAAQGIYTGLVPAIILINIPSAVTSTLAVVIGAVSVATFVIFFVMLKPTWAVTEPSAPPTAYAGA